MPDNSLTKDNSTVVSMRVTNAQREEFIALSKALGSQTSRMLREAFEAQLELMRARVDEKRALHGVVSWTNEWIRLTGGDYAEQP